VVKTAKPAGYSGTPLLKKLGFTPNARVKLRGAPPNYAALLGELPKGVVLSKTLRSSIDLWHLFATSRHELEVQLPRCMKEIAQAGMIWVSWPKRSSKVATDITEDVVREVALPLGLVDVKVCAVDETWSGLKLVIRRELRR
jgi:hypothetical protein